jgi:signal transduction histidine kinase
VVLTESEGRLQLEVHDDGTGFDPEQVSSGFGLAGMQERVSLAGGTLSIDSSEEGTRLRASIPARRAGAPQAGRHLTEHAS